MKYRLKTVEAFLTGRDASQGKFEAKIAKLVAKAQQQVAKRYPGKATGADELNESLLPLLKRYFAGIKPNELSDEQHQAYYNRIYNWTPNTSNSEIMAGFAAAQQIILFDILKTTEQRYDNKIAKLDQLCAKYEAHLQAKYSKGQAKQLLTRSTIKAREKLAAVSELREVLANTGKHSKARIHHFKERLDHVSNILKSHRNALSKRFLTAAAVILSGGVIGLIALAVRSKASVSNSFAFWRSHGEQITKSAKRFTL